MAKLVKIPGVVMVLAGTEYVIPPLTIGAVSHFEEQIKQLRAGDSAAFITGIETVIEIIHAAIVRNYPDMSLKDVGDIVDLGNMDEVLGVVMDVSGVIRKAQEKGEVPPGQA